MRVWKIKTNASNQFAFESFQSEKSSYWVNQSLECFMESVTKLNEPLEGSYDCNLMEKRIGGVFDTVNCYVSYP